MLFLLFQALDTLGNTKWRINKRILGVVERIWSSGGDLAGLVNRDDVSGFMSSFFLQLLLILILLWFFPFQVPLPEKPDTEDETLIKKWKWEIRSVKKENMERHSQRCDIELKLAVWFHLLQQLYLF